MRIAVAGAGAFGIRHLDALALIDGVTVTSVISRRLDQAGQVAEKYGAVHASANLDDALARDDVDAVILCTPTGLHAAQAIDCLRAGKHVQVEIPLADSWAGRPGGGPGAAGDRPDLRWWGTPDGSTRRTSGSTAGWWRGSCRSSSWTSRRTSSAGPTPTRWASRAAGPITCCGTTPPTPWTCSSTRPGSRSASPTPSRDRSIPDLGIAMDMSIQLRTPAGRICTLSLSFNNDGPLGSFFRYICDHGTYLARYDDLVTGREDPIDVSAVDVSANGIELQDREFITAIREGRQPNSSVADVLSCYRLLGELETELAGQA